MAMERPPRTLEDIVSDCGLETSSLDFKCPRKIIDRIAPKIMDVSLYLFGRTDLNVSEERLRSINCRNHSLEEKAVAILDAWAEEFESRATCLRLAECLHQRTMTSVIEFLCDEVIIIIISQHVTKTDDQVVTETKQLELRFSSLHEEIVSELTSGTVSVAKFLNALTFLPYEFEVEQEYKPKINEKLPVFLTEKEIMRIFVHINPMFSFLDFGLVKHIIDKLGSDNLRKKMTEYSEDVVAFMKRTTLKQLMDHWSDLEKVPKDYRILVVKINKDPKTHTLYELDIVRKRFCRELKMSTLFPKIIGLRMANSFIVEWLIPSEVVPQLVESAQNVDSGFYRRNCILNVVVDGKNIFPYDCTPMESANQDDDNSVTLYSKPTNLQVHNITCDSVDLSWTKPVQGDNHISSYTVLHKSVDNPQEQWLSEWSSTEETIRVTRLQPKTSYVFKISPEYCSRHGIESDCSSPVETKPRIERLETSNIGADGKYGVCPDSDFSLDVKMQGLQLSEIIKKKSKRLDSEESLPEIYLLPTKEVMKSEGENKLSRYVIGTPPRSSEEKVLMLVGPTGSGKTTLLNGIVNHVLGVRFEDNFRFKINSDEGGRNQANSQTDLIAAYTLHPMEGSKVTYSLTVIDTPGFGNTEGATKDKETVAQIRKFLSIEGVNKVDHLNGVGIVLESSSSRLTKRQKYVFDLILSLFGENISSKIFLMITFADGQDPPVLHSAREAQIGFTKYFKFNNCSLFATPTENFVRIFWEMGTKNYDQFLAYFGQSSPVSVYLTREVLKERKRLECITQELRVKADALQDKLDDLSKKDDYVEYSAELLDITKLLESFTKMVKQARESQDYLKINSLKPGIVAEMDYFVLTEGMKESCLKLFNKK